MITYIKILIPVLLMMVILCPGYSQSFEGCLTLRATYDGVDKQTSVMKIKDDQTVLEVSGDSTESLRIVKDYTKETSTLLRRKNDLKYGLRTNYIESAAHHPEVNEGEETGDVIMEITDQVKMIGTTSCTKYIFKSADAISEAWITKDISVSLSHYFPELLGSNVDPALYDLRKSADKEGFVTRYWEKLLLTGQENSFEMTPEAKDVPMEAFAISADYHVYDEEGLKRLAQDAQRNEERRKEWEGFMQLFGRSNR